MPQFIAYTDGACLGNPGLGGWAAVILGPEGKVAELGGRVGRTTNNRMEITAAIEALRALRRRVDEPVELYTDSTYLIDGITRWIKRWKRRGWTTTEDRPVLNRDLWEQLDAILQTRGPDGEVHWRHVRGHRGNPGNERCDSLAVAFARGDEPPLYRGPADGYPIDLARHAGQTGPYRSAGPRTRMQARRGRRGRPRQERHGAVTPRPPSRVPVPSGVFYVSLVEGQLERHATWAECERRVLGRSKALFRKCRTRQEEEATLRAWGVLE